MIKINRYKLSNGLTLLHNYNAATRMVALNLLFDVGSKHDPVDHTGMAHLMEHLYFSGTSNVPNFENEIEKAGGVCNANTSPDRTCFYIVVPAQNIETAFWLEADRLSNFALSDEAVKVQKDVVIEEFKQRCLNAPYGDKSHLILPLAYTQHPYRYPSIGEKVENIANISRTDVEAFFYANYSTANAFLCVTGNVKFERVIELAQKWFGDIERRHIAARNIIVEPQQTEPRHISVSRNVPQPLITKVYHMCGRCHSDYPATDLLTDVLATGKSARFYRNIISVDPAFSHLDSAVMGLNEPGLLIISALLTSNADVEKANETIDKEIRNLLTDGISSHELERCINKFISRSLLDNISYVEKAAKLCDYELLGDANLINSEQQTYRSVTPSDIMKVAHNVLRPENCSTMIYMPPNHKN